MTQGSGKQGEAGQHSAFLLTFLIGGGRLFFETKKCNGGGNATQIIFCFYFNI
jgi:hypothetical protein